VTGYAARVSATDSSHPRFTKPSAVWRFAPGLRGAGAHENETESYEYGLVVCVGPRITDIWACRPTGDLILDDLGSPVQLRSLYRAFRDESKTGMADRISADGYIPVTD
jgi:hypothetical protein